MSTRFRWKQKTAYALPTPNDGARHTPRSCSPRHVNTLCQRSATSPSRPNTSPTPSAPSIRRSLRLSLRFCFVFCVEVFFPARPYLAAGFGGWAEPAGAAPPRSPACSTSRTRSRSVAMETWSGPLGCRRRRCCCCRCRGRSRRGGSLPLDRWWLWTGERWAEEEEEEEGGHRGGTRARERSERMQRRWFRKCSRWFVFVFRQGYRIKTRFAQKPVPFPAGNKSPKILWDIYVTTLWN